MACAQHVESVASPVFDRGVRGLQGFDSELRSLWPTSRCDTGESGFAP